VEDRPSRREGPQVGPRKGVRTIRSSRFLFVGIETLAEGKFLKENEFFSFKLFLLFVTKFLVYLYRGLRNLISRVKNEKFLLFTLYLRCYKARADYLHLAESSNDLKKHKNRLSHRSNKNEKKFVFVESLKKLSFFSPKLPSIYPRNTTFKILFYFSSRLNVDVPN
jgi:hypothetical protein